MPRVEKWVGDLAPWGVILIMLLCFAAQYYSVNHRIDTRTVTESTISDKPSEWRNKPHE
jgi:F0F1-type ATP synthase assembly protein I